MLVDKDAHQRETITKWPICLALMTLHKNQGCIFVRGSFEVGDVKLSHITLLMILKGRNLDVLDLKTLL